MKFRNPVTSLLLGLFVPFYTLYWWYDTGKSMRQIGVRDVPSIAPVILVMLLYLGVVVGVVIKTVTAAINDPNFANGSGSIPPYFLIIYLFVPLLWGVNAWYSYRFSKAAYSVAPYDMGPGMMTVIFVLLAPLAIYLIQEKINLGTNNTSAAPIN